jgi:hypothetical protein
MHVKPAYVHLLKGCLLPVVVRGQKEIWMVKPCPISFALSVRYSTNEQLGYMYMIAQTLMIKSRRI